MLAAVLPLSCLAETLRVATYGVDLTRRGPGLLLRDLDAGDAPDADAAASAIRAADPDVLLLTGFDYDGGLAALAAFNRLIGRGAAAYPQLFALRPNTGRASGLDLDGDGRLGGPGDAQGYGSFAGQGGMAVLTRYPVEREAVRDFSGLLWRDLPGARMPVSASGGPFPSAEAQAVQRLPTTGHWDVPVRVGRSVLHLLAFHASPPVFDGPEDRNGLRAADEVRLWQRYLDGALVQPPPELFVILGDANLDPEAGDGDRETIAGLLADPRVQDPMPVAGGRAETAWWDDPPGPLRVDYVLPAAGLRVTGAGIVRPERGALADLLAAPEATRHRLVWVDLALD